MFKEGMLFFLLLLSSSLLGWSQNTAILNGKWSGKLTQVDGGFSDEYDFEIYVIGDDKSYQGRTYVEVPNVLGIMSFTAKLNSKTFYLEEAELLYSRKPEDMSWCFKRMQLRVVKRKGQWYLEGPWQGSSKYGNCQPGWVSLVKEVPKV
ncbi:MAG: hypothetical protein AAGJ93_15705 [Bacteroidota bacterium]